MKSKIQYIVLVALIVCLSSCKKDNFSEPTSLLSGKVVYKGDPIEVEFGKVTFEIYQFGFGRVGPIGSSVAQDGSYSVLLFDGEYKLIFPNGQGPFMWPRTASGNPDSITIDLKGSKELNIEVMPYYMVRNSQFDVSAGKVTATCKAEKIITDANAKDIEQVTLYINKTQFVSADYNIGRTSVDGSAIADPSNISLEVEIPSMKPDQNYVFARIGLKIAGVEDRIFSPIQKLSF